MGQVIAFGLDPSLTSFGVAATSAVDGEVRSRRSWALQPPEGVKGVDRLAWFRSRLGDLFEPVAGLNVLVAIEDYAFSRGASHAHGLGEIGGVSRLLLFDRSLPFTEIKPTSLKKFVTGKGNAPKDVVRLEAYKRFDLEAVTSDEVEAGCLSLMVLASKGLVDFGLPKANMESLSKVVW